jgi:glycosidase
MRIIVIFLVFLVQSSLVAQINHVEPLNWWIGMKNPALQVLVNGKDVSETKPVINYNGVTIKSYTIGDSKNYLFIDLLIDRDTKPGSVPINFTKAGKTVYTYNYTLLARESGTAQLTGFSSSDAIYLIMSDRFANGDPKNDANASMLEKKTDRAFDGGRHGGDIRGIISHLDYIADMGFTAIWPTPMLENNMERYSYHGYSITDHYKVDPRFGTLDEYKELAQKAREKGIKLIFDDVVNHIGLNYWWMNDLPFKDWINLPDTRSRSNHRRTTHQDKYASAFDGDQMTKGWFDTTMPDKNCNNPFMATYLIQCSIWWIETLQLGGTRQDTYPYSDKDFLKDWSCAIMNEYPEYNIVGEEWSLNPLITSYWQQGKQNNDGYTSCLKSVMDFPIHSALTQALSETDEGWRLGDKLNGLYEALANDFAYADPKNILVFADNHDMERVFKQLGTDPQLVRMALTYVLTIRGIPQVFYGTEILMNSPGPNKVDGIIRSDFPGGWAGDAVNAFTGTGLTDDQKQMQDYLKKLLNWRKTSPVIANGETMHFAPFDGLYVYFRYTSEKTVMVVMNKKTTATTMDVKRFAEIIKGKSTAMNVITGESVSLNNPLTITPKSALVFEIK